MNKTFIITLIIAVFTLASSNLFAQSKKYFFSIGNQKHYAQEFNYAYSKNNINNNAKKDSLDAYLELYINFRLKVKEAKANGYDTTDAFKQEFNQYKSQLDNSYLTPKKEQEALVKEAYERSLWEIRASHILIRTSENSSPSDTLKAYTSIIKLRNRVLQGEDFSELAKIKSDDPSAKQNGGDLGYFSVFQMVYPFESAAYNTAVGKVSKPIRTQFGYHIINVVDKRKNNGKVQVAHIMIRSTSKNGDDKKVEAKQKAFKIDSLLKSGGDWNKLCKLYSQDQNSVAQNGVLKPFGRGQIVPEFEQAAFNLANVEDISAPVQTPFGWHIIKLVRKIPIGSYNEEKAKLGRRVKSDSRALMPQNEMLNTLKKENDFARNEVAIIKLKQMPPSVIVEHKWQFDSLQLANQSTLFSIGSQTYTTSQFLTSINNSTVLKGANLEIEVERNLKAYEDSIIINNEKSLLPTKYPDYSFLVNEYYDGILLFSIMEDSIWNQSMKDSIGLSIYYEANKKNYTAHSQDTTIFSSNSQSTLEAVAKNQLSKQNSDDWQVLNSKLLKEYNVSPLTLHTLSKEDTTWAKLILFNNSQEGSPFEMDGKWYWVRIAKVLSYVPLNKIKGSVISDYQSYLDDKWIAELRKKYPVKINKKQKNKVYAHFKALD